MKIYYIYKCFHNMKNFFNKLKNEIKLDCDEIFNVSFP